MAARESACRRFVGTHLHRVTVERARTAFPSQLGLEKHFASSPHRNVRIDWRSQRVCRDRLLRAQMLQPCLPRIALSLSLPNGRGGRARRWTAAAALLLPRFLAPWTAGRWKCSIRPIRRGRGRVLHHRLIGFRNCFASLCTASLAFTLSSPCTQPACATLHAPSVHYTQLVHSKLHDSNAVGKVKNE